MVSAPVAIRPSQTPIFLLWSTGAPERNDTKSGGLMRLMTIRISERTPRPVTIALAATGRPTSESDAASSASAMAAIAVRNRTTSVNPYEPQAFLD